MPERVTATRAVREFSELLNEIRYRSKSYIVERNGKPIARLVPAGNLNEGKQLKDLKSLLLSLPSCGDDLETFEADLRKIADNQPSLPAGDSWV
jgi:prevent-host-death family protein